MKMHSVTLTCKKVKVAHTHFYRRWVWSSSRS